MCLCVLVCMCVRARACIVCAVHNYRQVLGVQSPTVLSKKTWLLVFPLTTAPTSVKRGRGMETVATAITHRWER